MIKKNVDLGLLILRVGMGISFIFHGWPKLAGGAKAWEKLGGAMNSLGIGFGHVFWGLSGALAEVVGGLLLALGLFTRWSSFFLALTMVVAVALHLDKGDGFKGYSNALKALIVFVSFIFMSGGRHSLDQILFKRD